ncbi:MAG: helicase-related protein, partial [Gemmatimonadaceae bacterium]
VGGSTVIESPSEAPLQGQHSSDPDPTPIRAATSALVRRAIARCVLIDTDQDISIGTVTLYPHQVSAVQQVQRTLREFGGALLCDAVGLGKTYTALAVAAAYGEPLIIAPAILGTMWQQALDCAGVRASFCSIEALSRGATITRRHALLIVDEAHHLRNPGTRRYAEAARLCIHSPVLLISATPIHNSRSDLMSLAALFMGIRAHSLDEAALSRIVVRRTRTAPAAGPVMPRVEHAPWRVLSTDDTILEQIIALPPPVPPSDGGQAATLVAHGLARQWVSSSAALLGALKRRMARSHALIAALDTGRYPTRAELQGWVFADDALQLAFPELLSHSDADVPELREAVTAHLQGLRALASHVSAADSENNNLRADFVRTVVDAHPREKVVAFTSYKETATALYRALARLGGVALMTSSGGTVVGGALTRRETLERFAPDACSTSPPGRRDHIRLLLTTDLLSEGVNLQDASVVIHLDLPWTAARLEQRTGRVARLGSRHAVVTSYALRPSERAEAFLRTVETVARKARVASTVLGSGNGLLHPGTSSGSSCVELTESMRSTLKQWLQHELGDEYTETKAADVAREAAIAATPLVACVSGPRPGAIVACVIDGRPELVVLNEDLQVRIDVASVSTAIAVTAGAERKVPLRFASRVMSALALWHESVRAAIDAGVDSSCIAGIGARRKRAAIRDADAASSASSFATRGAGTKRASLLRSSAALPMPIALEQLMYGSSDASFWSGYEYEPPMSMVRGNVASVVELGLTIVAILLME